MTDIVKFLRARYAEQEVAAKTANGIWPGPWTKTRAVYGWRVTAGQRQVIIGHPAATEYIASHDARWALADIDAKLRLLEQFELRGNSVRATVVPATGGVWDDLLRLLALPYAEHADYDRRWRPADA